MNKNMCNDILIKNMKGSWIRSCDKNG